MRSNRPKPTHVGIPRVAWLPGLVIVAACLAFVLAFRRAEFIHLIQYYTGG